MPEKNNLCFLTMQFFYVYLTTLPATNARRDRNVPSTAASEYVTTILTRAAAYCKIDNNW
jgi:hypothetical protein